MSNSNQSTGGADQPMQAADPLDHMSSLLAELQRLVRGQRAFNQAITDAGVDVRSIIRNPETLEAEAERDRLLQWKDFARRMRQLLESYQATVPVVARFENDEAQAEAYSAAESQSSNPSEASAFLQPTARPPSMQIGPDEILEGVQQALEAGGSQRDAVVYLIRSTFVPYVGAANAAIEQKLRSLGQQIQIAQASKLSDNLHRMNLEGAQRGRGTGRGGRTGRDRGFDGGRAGHKRETSGDGRDDTSSDVPFRGRGGRLRSLDGASRGF